MSINYVKYESFFKIDNVESENVITENMKDALNQSFKNLNTYIEKQTSKPFSHERNIDWLINKLGSSKEEIVKILSLEQMDSVGLAIFKIENDSTFIVGDETGIGKGRILSAVMRYTLLQDYNVVFFSESSNLFSDIYRDIINTNTEQYVKNVFLLHATAKVINFNTGDIIAKSLTGDNFKNVIKTGSFKKVVRGKEIEIPSNLIFSTYSQFNRKESAKEKINFLEKFINKNTVLIFDEFHNQTNVTSNIFDSIEKIKKIADRKGRIIQSSATFLDNFNKIESFKNMLDITDKDDKVIDYLKNSDNLSLEFSNQIAFLLTKKSSLLRREHSFIEKINYVDISNEHQNTLNRHLNQYRDFISELFDCYVMAEKLTVEELKNKWIRFGGLIGRLAKLIILSSKKEFLISRIEQLLSEDKKVVIALDSTFEAIVKKCIEFENFEAFKKMEFASLANIDSDETEEDDLEITEEDKNKTYSNLNVSGLLRIIAHEIMDEPLQKIKNNKLDAQFDKVLAKIDNFPNIDISIIDTIRIYFEDKNIKTLEISGRKNYVTKINDKYKINSVKVEDKSTIVKKFNDGESDVIFLSRSGATGLSLHASQDFIDQRQRALIELEITPRVKLRLQFFGRVNRRGQVCKPIFESIKSNTSFEKRTIALEEKKLSLIRSFTGSDYKVDSIDFDYYNEFTNNLAKLYLISNSVIAKKLGIYAYSNEYMYHIDMLLKRSILLPDDIQENIFNYLNSGNELYTELDKKYEMEYKNKISQDLMFTKVDRFIDNLSISEESKYDSLDRKDKIVSELKAVALVDAHNKIKIGSISVDEMTTEIIENQLKFNKTQYLNNLFFVELNTMYENGNLNVVKKNYVMLRDAEIGNQIVFNINDSVYYGYIKNIEYPSEMFNDISLGKYLSHYRYTVRLINPNLIDENKRILLDEIPLTGNILLENSNLKIIDKEIDFSKYVRNDEETLIKHKMLIGNVFYTNFIQNAYKIGEFISFSKEIDNNHHQFFALKLPNNINIDKVFKRHPLFNMGKMLKDVSMGKLITSYNKKIAFQRVKDNEGDSTEYVLRVHEDILNDDEIFDYVMNGLIDKEFKVDDNKNYYYSFFKYERFSKVIFKLFYNKKLCLFSESN